MNPTKEQIVAIIDQYDLDGDGHIDFSEYKQIYLAYFSDEYRKQPQPTENEVLEAFREFDRDSSGVLTVQKIQAMADKMQMTFTNEEVKKIIEELSESNQGHLDWISFRNAILQ